LPPALGGGGPVGPRSRVHAKALSREVPMRKGHFLPEPSGDVDGAVFRQRSSRPQSSSAMRARLPGKRSGSVGRSGLSARRACLWQGQFSEAWDWRSKAFSSLLLLADNYIQQQRTKPQRHEGTKDAQRFDAFYSFAIHAGCRMQRRAAAGPRSEALGVRLHS
jgi:hypothetical protein